MDKVVLIENQMIRENFEESPNETEGRGRFVDVPLTSV
jgi:hypothetical protein